MSRDMSCAPSDVMDILADGERLALWVVGANRVRSVDPEWPAVGATVQHSMGSWPILISDTTTVTVHDPSGHLRLTAAAAGVGTFELSLSVHPTTAGCRVTLAEDAVAGPVSFVPAPIRTLLLHVRNRESLRRLGYLAEGRCRQRATQPSPDGTATVPSSA